MILIFQKKQGGFVALFSVIIVSFVLLLVATTLNLSGFYGRFNILDSESKESSSELADACIESARLKLAVENNFIGGPISVNVGDKTCDYKISSGGKIIASAEINNAFTFYYVEVDLTKPKIPITNLKVCKKLSPCP